MPLGGAVSLTSQGIARSGYNTNLSLIVYSFNARLSLKLKKSYSKNSVFKLIIKSAYIIFICYYFKSNWNQRFKISVLM